MRLAIQDRLQTHPFWLMDAALMDRGAPVLSPLYGFSSITAPEVTAETKDISEGNWIWTTKVLKNRLSVGNITLTRGVTVADIDFYAWIMNAVAGDNYIAPASDIVSRIFNQGRYNPRRDLILLHFFARDPSGGLIGAGANFAGQLSVESNFLPEIGPVDAVSTAARMIPARAFYLRGCLPIRYKSGSDFDATSAQVSVAELELAVEQMEQILLSS